MWCPKLLSIIWWRESLTILRHFVITLSPGLPDTHEKHANTLLNSSVKYPGSPHSHCHPPVTVQTCHSETQSWDTWQHEWHFMPNCVSMSHQKGSSPLQTPGTTNVSSRQPLYPPAPHSCSDSQRRGIFFCSSPLLHGSCFILLLWRVS